MDSEDHYVILNVKRDATPEEIKRSYKKLILQYHPDKNRNSQTSDMFNKIREAYETLNDPLKREKYDRCGNFDKKSILEEILYCYNEIIVELCEKYNLDENDKNALSEIFSPDDYKYEIENNDLNSINQKIINKLYPPLQLIILKKIRSYPLIDSIINLFTATSNSHLDSASSS